jgi:dolichol-phosphate mannosyltransferase
MRTLSVIAATRNERDTIPRLLDGLRSALEGVDYELIFVDDSTDGTEHVLAEAARLDARVTVMHRAPRDRLAAGLAEGLGRGRGEFLAVMDADLWYPPAMLPVLLDRLVGGPADVVVASRYLPGAGPPAPPVLRWLISHVTRRLAQAMLGGARRSTDPLSGFFALRRAVIDGVVLQPAGDKILLGILVRGRYAQVDEVPYVYPPGVEKRSAATVGQGLQFLRHLVTLTAGSPPDARLWKFLLVGASGVLVNVVAFWALTQPLGVHYLAAGVAAGLLSTLSNYLLNSAFTWADRPPGNVSTFLSRMGRYYVATWAGFLLYLALLWGVTHLGVVPMLSNLFAIGVSGLVNYLMHNVWTWRQLDARP